MGIFSYLFTLIIVGLVIGGLGRLVVPGPNPIGLPATLGIGLVGAILGAIIGGLFGLGLLSIVPEVGISAGLVYASGKNRRQLTR